MKYLLVLPLLLAACTPIGQSSTESNLVRIDEDYWELVDCVDALVYELTPDTVDDFKHDLQYCY